MVNENSLESKLHYMRNCQKQESTIHHEEGKLFIGGLDWSSTDESLRNYFSKFGEVKEARVMKWSTGVSRGFGFVVFTDPSSVDEVLKHGHNHILDGKAIDPKRAIPREEQDKIEKVFIGGIPPEITDELFRKYFARFGKVHDATLMLDRDGKPRGFGFVTFEADDGPERLLHRKDLTIKGKPIEIKRAFPKPRQQQHPHVTSTLSPSSATACPNPPTKAQEMKFTSSSYPPAILPLHTHPYPPYPSGTNNYSLQQQQLPHQSPPMIQPVPSVQQQNPWPLVAPLPGFCAPIALPVDCSQFYGLGYVAGFGAQTGSREQHVQHVSTAPAGFGILNPVPNYNQYVE
ncbi:uncharacterized protein VTP21DRAFT_427 [Calcarisporiella thermophila]|uniref:uncharacterized protein n=1 Tax=Calcarisporiella thermophila TaxID=911321 RepID=UPI003744988B